MLLFYFIIENKNFLEDFVLHNSFSALASRAIMTSPGYIPFFPYAIHCPSGDRWRVMSFLGPFQTSWIILLHCLIWFAGSQVPSLHVTRPIKPCKAVVETSHVFPMIPVVFFFLAQKGAVKCSRRWKVTHMKVNELPQRGSCEQRGAIKALGVRRCQVTLLLGNVLLVHGANCAGYGRCKLCAETSAMAEFLWGFDLHLVCVTWVGRINPFISREQKAHIFIPMSFWFNINPCYSYERTEPPKRVASY